MDQTLKGDGTWPFTATIDGDDIVVSNITITCFGGLDDPQDPGDTASGVNTKRNPTIAGVALPMNIGPRSPHTQGSPIPKLPWGTPVEVTIGKFVSTPAKGVIDIGPGKQASKPGDPHALDLTPGAAQFFSPDPLERLATNFEAQGSYRIIGGAKFV